MRLFSNVDKRANIAFELMANQLGCSEVIAPLERSGSFDGGVMTVRYIEKRRFFSRIYKLHITLALSGHDAPAGEAHWKKGRHWTGNPAVSDWLAGHAQLSGLSSLIDIETASYRRKTSDATATVDLVTLPGCFIWTLVPPMHYFVKLNGKEIDGLRRLLGRYLDINHV
ncbi:MULTISPECIES: hypothetical protein [unclassified Modicisalibacter]|uniref:hypothetical protein n=1 Tax=unclassified Modicisalibacter TaxID=2679913 RepID=UPI001CCA6E9A|nr:MULTISPECIES: hypothetical protein [unclassified Modicisalibacter]MBZ9558031.1 hypothetical protein [Modicisalibacter sp. R2A 31.J]MBZ9573301.1 hypothetical protein [Modicisalibacter sp. MOD 31.J]